MKHSIKKQMALVIILCIAGVSFLSWGINYFFLEDYYIFKKTNMLVSIFEEMNINEDFSEENLNSKFQKKFSDNNLSSCIILNGDTSKPLLIGDRQEMMLFKLTGYMFERTQVSDRLIRSTSSYFIQKSPIGPESIGAGENVTRIAGNQFVDVEELELYGRLDNGGYIILTSPIESLRTTAKISSEFLGIVSAIGLVLSILVVWYISKKATEPILELVDISDRMTHLDFDAKYKSGGHNEISLLGTHFNKMSEALEHTISELKSANIELQKDLEEKVQIDEMRKEFLSNISHELKTPIALIQGYAEGLQEGINDNDESRDFYCEVIIDEANKMNKMVKKLLTLNQIEFGQEKIMMERFDIISLIDGVLQSSDILIKQKKTSVIFNEEASIYVWGDEFKVEEVVTNYITNALNHVKNENIIEIRVENNKKSVRVSVFNSGDIIPEEDLDKIWIKFYKVDKARTREYGGSGIGLSIVKAIMDSFQKECGVQNYGNGVEFWFELDKDESFEKE
jgi:two-component system sensor histidine kinase VanS